MGLHLADLALYRSSSQRHSLVTLPSGVTGDKSRFHLRALVAGVSGQTEPTKLAGLLTSYSHVASLIFLSSLWHSARDCSFRGTIGYHWQVSTYAIG
jgi:hypothetical protein